jgi:hypothetical protein
MGAALPLPPRSCWRICHMSRNAGTDPARAARLTRRQSSASSSGCRPAARPARLGRWRTARRAHPDPRALAGASVRSSEQSSPQRAQHPRLTSPRAWRRGPLERTPGRPWRAVGPVGSFQMARAAAASTGPTRTDLEESPRRSATPAKNPRPVQIARGCPLRSPRNRQGGPTPPL